ncbi:NAD(P)H-hydrate epimerase [Lachnoanaerobaculum sp. Marseille-Q4761]|uniref:NAD(P)H-hydrate epimerase n=1 Tax=Lachnoanaerobaculum sp. Marseille-Q4761 TaxID=2819511 RepID=UPI001AA13BAE|nr:NAD(P)H-hydrate epimerase [Lachnoanaerobaculum sp. Marseille-Q4761]MBO1871254.1 NAD(P)H-hydrate epimerase [Lachnoanaerobaculum sp. Marseille-Q4761]
MIRFEKIDENTNNLEEIKQLYLDAFPFEERIPFYIMVLVGNDKGVEFLSIYDDDTWLGFIHTLVGDELSYIFYFAIDNRLRRSGYGSKILHEYKKIHPRLSLAIEPIEENSDNIKQRRKRLEFYKKNGFETLDTKVVEMGIEFELMGAKGMEIKESDYKKLVKKFFDSFDQGRVLSVKEMRDADSYTIANFIDSKELMYRAGEAIFYVANWDIGDKVLILAGSGNNAGDGYVAADLLNIEEIDVEILLIKEKFSEDGKYYFNICKQKGIKYSVLDENMDYNTLLGKFNSYDYILDCIYGTGFVGEVREPVYSIIKAVNNSRAEVVSADINSGMNGDTGESDICIDSDLTVSIGFLKKGLITEEAKKHIGRLVNMDIGIVVEEKK